MKIALVHEFLTQYGGAERVLDCFLEIWPEADIFTLIYDKNKMGSHYEKYQIKSSFIQNLPSIPPAKYKWWLLFYPKAMEKFDFSGYDLVLSDSSAFAKGVITHQPTRHICYLHTPTRYLWSVTKEYLQDAPIPSVIRPFMPPVIKYLKKWDFQAAQRPEYIIANSQNVAKRAKKYYHRSPDKIIFPPVDVQRFSIKKIPRTYWLVVGRQVPYKRTDIVIKAANKLGFNLVVAGSGTKIDKLIKLAGSRVKFVGRVSDLELANLYAGSIALIFPPDEDAGITPLEAMACGRPVIAYRSGGALETVEEGLSGEFFDRQTPESLVDAIKKFHYTKYDPEKIRDHALKYDKAIFKKKIKDFINSKINL